MRYLDKMMRIEDIIFWILISAVIGVAIWIMLGSPPLENGVLMMVIFIATSEILIWRYMFSLDKKTAVSFVKLRTEMNNRFNTIDNKLDKLMKK